ncbi:conserved exported hypothetical protein [Verrucomicrobia bacterium]|nr:conserved exported hypothetical protein [Verrucomicrobiota bacterium]
MNGHTYLAGHLLLTPSGELRPNRRARRHRFRFASLAGLFANLALILAGWPNGAGAQPATFAGNAQHISQYATPAQHLNQVLWSTTINLTNTGAFAHYAAPLVTPSNTVIVSVRIVSGFEICAFDGATGRLKYTLTNDYILPTYDWLPVYQPVIASAGGHLRLYYPGAGGTVYYVDNIDSDVPGSPTQECFYADLGVYQQNALGANGFNNTVFIDTPITPAADGVIFFGFRIQGTALAPLGTAQSGYARLDPSGNGNYMLAGTGSGDSQIGHDCHNCAPALSNDGSTLYVVVKDANDSSFGYLLGLNSTNLATEYQAPAQDTNSTSGVYILDKSTASPMVGPDGDVFFGINASDDRGLLLHFSSDLKTQMPSGGFGWDYTAGVVPTSMVPGYQGLSPYLLIAKYNNYANVGDFNGDGVNRIALLDPHATQVDPHPSAHGLVEMREVLSVTGPTPDLSFEGVSYPYAVREWCVNTAAVNLPTSSIFAPSEDGHIYRWNLAENSLSEALALTPGFGEPYVPTVIGPDGTVFTLNGGKLFALGALTNAAITLAASVPDLLSVLAGQAVTFTALVSNLNGTATVPTGTMDFQDVTYNHLTAVTNILAAAVALTNGMASVTTSNLVATTNYLSSLGSHFITALYSGDTTFPAGSVTRVEKIHARATTTALSLTETLLGGPVTLTASVSSGVGGNPTGFVSFWAGSNFLAQIPLRTNGLATATVSAALAGSSAALSANYSSDTVFASSSGSAVATPAYLANLTFSANGLFQFSFSNTIGLPFSVWSSSDLSLPLSNWGWRGSATEVSPGQFQFTDSQAPVDAQRFYRVSSP